MNARKEFPVTFSIFTDVYDTDPYQHSTSLKKFVTHFKELEFKGSKDRVTNINLVVYGEKPNAKGSRRVTENIQEVRGIFLDIDNKDGVTVDLAMIEEKLSDYMYVAHTTYSSTPEKPRYRVVLVFSKPTSPDHIPAIFEHFNTMFEGGLDPASRNPNQIYLAPSCPPGKADNYDVKVHRQGQLFDPDSVPRQPEKPQSKKTKALAVVDLPTDLEKIDIEALDLELETKHLIRTGDASKYGGDRSKAAYRVICDLIAGGYMDTIIASILLDPDYGISTRHLEKGVEWVAQEIARARAKCTRQPRFIPDVLPHYPDENALHPDVAWNRLGIKILNFVLFSMGYKGIKAPAGLGKTEVCIKIFEKFSFHFRLIEYYTPTHKLAQELETRLKRAAPHLKVQVIRGRTHKDSADDTLCAKASTAANLGTRGIGVFKTLCRDDKGNECEHFSQCPYLAQFKPDTQVRIFTHAHLALDRGFLDKEIPDLAIIDESFFGSLIDPRQTTLDELMQFVKPKRLAKVIRNALLGGRPLLYTLRREFGDELEDVFDRVATALTEPTPAIDPTMSEIEVNRSIARGRWVPAAIKILLKNLRHELEQFPRRKRSRVVLLSGTDIHVANRKSITRLTLPGGDLHEEFYQIPTLCIDADLCPKINRVFLPGFKKHEIRAKRKAHVTQVSSTRNSRQRFHARRDGSPGEKERAAQHIEQTQTVIGRICEGKRGLIVGYEKVVGNRKKNIPPLIKTPPSCSVEHFGGLRGIDRYKDSEVVVIVGRHQFPTLALEIMGASLWWDSPRALKLRQQLDEEVRGYRRTEGTGGVTVMVHPDRRIQLLQEQLRESETLQAIDRLRLIHAKSPKEVWILSNVPLDIDVDRLVSWRDLVSGGSPIEQAFAHYDGVMPLSPQFLYENHKDLFKSESSAKQVVSRFKKAGGNTISDTLYWLSLNTLCHLFEYRVQGTPGKPKTALCDRDIPVQTVKKRLQQLHGAPITIIKRVTPAADSAQQAS